VILGQSDCPLHKSKTTASFRDPIQELWFQFFFASI
jgi:hypothetical protein